ncbi:MAG: tripartite tricarboxylate transporter substrate binding protein [Betaproteobacteria bacterium]|nr:tripartite tricarboxylate transporter substrate binding protein [Betaproteobacteria bacterium]
MKHSLRILAALAALAVAGTTFAQGAAGYPSRPIRLVVSFAPGGTADTVGRIVGEGLAARLGQPVVADNRPGANSAVACEIVSQANPDGYTMVIVAAGFAVNPSLRKKLPYDSLRDFAPVGLAGSGPYLLTVHPSVPAKTLGEFIAWAKARPGQVTYASTGIGSPPHLAAELLRSMAGLDLVHVPYKGGGQVMPDFLAGRVPMFFGSISTLVAHIRAGKLRAIAMTTPQRAPAMPEVPTFDESGLKGYDVTGWYGLLVPGKTPPAIVNRLNTELRHALGDPQVRKQLEARGITPTPVTPAEFAKLIRTEIPKWAKLMKAAGIKPQ